MKKKLNCVLLIDDDDTNNFINTRALELAAIAEHIEVKLNGKEAIEYLVQKTKTGALVDIPSLIFLDINMPIMDGWEFIKAYQEEKLDQTINTNIVMLSTSTNPDDIKRANNTPLISAFKSKPLSSDIIKEMIHNYFEEYL